MRLFERVQSDLRDAMKAGDRFKTSALRMLIAALKNERIEKRGELDEEAELVVVAREVKKRREAAAQYRTSGAEDRAASEESEADVFSAYLPDPLTEEEVDAAVEEVVASVGATSRKDMGRVMGELMSRYRGRIDGKIAQQKVLAKLD